MTSKENTYKGLLAILHQTQLDFHSAVSKWIESNYSEETRVIVEFYQNKIKEIEKEIDQLFSN